jgi:hypothetical protein
MNRPGSESPSISKTETSGESMNPQLGDNDRIQSFFFQMLMFEEKLP